MGNYLLLNIQRLMYVPSISSFFYLPSLAVVTRFDPSDIYLFHFLLPGFEKAVADIQFYLALSVIYLAFGIYWGVLCYKHLSELL
jgi:hypothetical protein